MNKEKTSEINDCSSIVFYGVTDTLSISDKSYKIVKKDNELEIKFTDSQVVKEIESIKCNKVRFCVEGKITVAKSNPVFSSKIPDNIEYYFSTDVNGNLMNIREDKTLYIRKVLN